MLKATGIALVAVIFGFILSKQGKEISLLLTIAVCCMTACIAITHLTPVIDFIRKIEQIGNLNSETIGVLIKCVGISVVTEIAVLICNDAAQSAMGKGLQFLGTALVLWLALPVFSGLLDLVEDILTAI